MSYIGTGSVFGLYRSMLNLLDLEKEAVNFQTSYCSRFSYAVNAAYRKLFEYLSKIIYSSCDHNDDVTQYSSCKLPRNSHDAFGDIQNGGSSNS